MIARGTVVKCTMGFSEYVLVGHLYVVLDTTWSDYITVLAEENLVASYPLIMFKIVIHPW